MSATPLRWIRAIALFDLAVTLPLAIPLLSDRWVALLLSGFGVTGTPAQWLPLPLSTSIFAVLAGLLAVLWNGCRAWQPQLLLLVRADVCGRVAVAAALTYFLLGMAAPVALWLFVASELIGAFVEYRALSALRR
jgi:hypothetical protein